ncbi:hypothetical protein DMENIID0001_136340 [Sergentomyia squamirostris]
MENPGESNIIPALTHAPAVSAVSEGFAGFIDENARPDVTGASGATSIASDATTTTVPGFSGGWKMSSREAQDAIPKYRTGVDSQVSTSQWLQIIDHLAAENAWSEAQRVHNAQTQLRDGAKSWYAANRVKIGSSWSIFKEKFCLAFPDELDFQMIQLRMMERKRSDKEALEDYVFEVFKMGESIKYPMKATLMTIVAGIPDFRVRNQIRVSDSTTVEDLLDQLRNAEAMVGQENIRKRLASETHQSPAKLRKHGKDQKQRGGFSHGKDQQKSPEPGEKEEASKTSQPEQKKKLTCWKCNKEGHIARKCRPESLREH